MKRIIIRFEAIPVMNDIARPVKKVLLDKVRILIHYFVNCVRQIANQVRVCYTASRKLRTMNRNAEKRAEIGSRVIPVVIGRRYQYGTHRNMGFALQFGIEADRHGQVYILRRRHCRARYADSPA